MCWKAAISFACWLFWNSPLYMTGAQPFVQLPSAHVASWPAPRKPGQQNHSLSLNAQQVQVPVKAGTFSSVIALPVLFVRHLWESYWWRCITRSELSPPLNLQTVWAIGKPWGEDVVMPLEMLGLLPSRMLTQRDRWYIPASPEQACSVTQPQDRSSVSRRHRALVTLHENISRNRY